MKVYFESSYMYRAFPPHNIYIGHNDQGYGISSRPLDRFSTTPYDYQNRFRDYASNILRDPRGDDGPKLESDIRTNYNMSQQRINLATYGSKSEKTPLIYDSDWTFHDMDRDVRGWSGEHRWEEKRKMDDRRYNLLPMADDLDKVPEGLMDPLLQMHAIKIWDRYLQATRFTNFGVTVDNLLKPVYNLRSTTAPTSNSAWEIMASIETNPFYRRSNTAISNDITMPGHMSVPDHKIETQKYGVLYGMAPLLDHESAMRIYSNENVYKDNMLMEKMAKRLRRLSDIRQAIEKVIVENGREKFTEESPRSIGLTSELLSLMGFTHFDLKEGRQDEQRANNPGMLQAHNDMKDFVHTLHNISDSQKEYTCKKIIGEYCIAMGDTRRALSNISRGQKIDDVKEYLAGKMPEINHSIINNTLIDVTTDVKAVNNGTTPKSLQGLHALKPHIVSRDISKSNQVYSVLELKQHVKMKDSSDQDIIDAQIFNSARAKLLDRDKRLAHLYERGDTIEHAYDRRELPDVNQSLQKHHGLNGIRYERDE
jgi:hypothetical protein